MGSITVPLSEDDLAQLEATADCMGLSPEELVLLCVREYILPEKEFRRVADYILAKNAELYRRLR